MRQHNPGLVIILLVYSLNGNCLRITLMTKLSYCGRISNNNCAILIVEGKQMKSIYLFFFIPVYTFSQNPENLFPYHVGDIWQYKNDWGHYWTRTVVKDSVDSDSSHHIFFENTMWDNYRFTDHYIADTLNQVWGYIYDSLLFLHYKLEADSGDIYYSGSIDDRDTYAIVKDVGTGYFFSKERLYKEYVFFESLNPENYPDGALEYSNAILVDSIGWAYSWYEVDAYDILQGCIINGKQYGTITDIADHSSGEIPVNCKLLPAYPNPFNSTVNIPVVIHNPEKITLSIYNILGQTIVKLHSGVSTAGKSIIRWDGTDDLGSVCPSGVYIIQLTTPEQTISQKIVLLK